MPSILVATGDPGLKETARRLLSRPGVHLVESSAQEEELWQAVSRFLDQSPKSTSASAETTLIGPSRSMERIRDYIRRVAASQSNVLITGETGTGKELAAQMIHRLSGRSARPFVCVNCAAIPDSLLESELFGHERGAYTGAHSSWGGRFQEADGGTVFLDEIGEMSPGAQAKILRAIETRQFQRLGASGPVRVNVRIVAATNQDLQRLAENNQFRKDLYFRLNVARVHLPPLRERKEDIPLLTSYWSRELAPCFGRNIEGFTDDALSALIAHDWPGNVRELRNLVERLYIETSARWIRASDLPSDVTCVTGPEEADSATERERLLQALVATNWNKSQAAARLNWSRMTVYRKMARYQLAVTSASRCDSACDNIVTARVTRASG